MKINKQRAFLLVAVLVGTFLSLTIGQALMTKVLSQATTVASLPSQPTPIPSPISDVKWEYRIVHVQREKADTFQAAFDTAGNSGWEYAGIVCNNGLNAHYVAFKRRKY